MSIKELTDFKHAAQEMADKYSKQLVTYGISDINTYVSNLDEREKKLLDERIKIVKLLEKIDKVIEKKLSEYYD